MTRLHMIAILAVTLPAIASATPATRHASHHAAALPAGKMETLRVAAISLTEDDGTVLTMKDTAGVKFEPVKVSLSICRKDHLGRLLPGMDVQLAVETHAVASKPTRFVRPERFRPWCN